MISLFTMSTIGCGTEDLAFNRHLFETETNTIEPILENLLWPTDLTTTPNGIQVIEQDASTIHQMSSSTIDHSWEWSETPIQILHVNDVTWVRTDSGLFPLEDSSESVEDNSITKMFVFNSDLHWLSSNDTSEIKNQEGTVMEIEASLDETVVVQDSLYVLDRQNQELLLLDTERGVSSVAFQFSDEPRKLFASEDALYVTTRSSRWPYGGWILRLDGSEDSWSETRLCDSPPEAEHLLVHDGSVYWSSKQSITRISTEGGTYDMIAPMSTVGDLSVFDSNLWWTDYKGGRVYRIPL